MRLGRSVLIAGGVVMSLALLAGCATNNPLTNSAGPHGVAGFFGARYPKSVARVGVWRTIQMGTGHKTSGLCEARLADRLVNLNPLPRVP